MGSLSHPGTALSPFRAPLAQSSKAPSPPFLSLPSLPPSPLSCPPAAVAQGCRGPLPPGAPSRAEAAPRQGRGGARRAANWSSSFPPTTLSLSLALPHISHLSHPFASPPPFSPASISSQLDELCGRLQQAIDVLSAEGEWAQARAPLSPSWLQTEAALPSLSRDAHLSLSHTHSLPLPFLCPVRAR